VTTIASREGVADWTVRVTGETESFTSFELTGPEGRALATRVSVIGRHMAANAGLAIVMLVEAGFELEAIGHALERDGQIVARMPGRIERVSGEAGPALYVDYGHSPDAFLATMDAIRAVTTGRLIMVFGADGDRDSGKRGDMGRIASEGSDILVVTDYNPRFEDPESIRSALLAGAASAEHPAEVHEIASQRDAIRLAVSVANANDAILWAGPGHEDYIDVRGEKLPFDARDEARQALREAGWE
jgi:UDP-N-acetylmuramoyl-L-alanyl-D-glutamate--2,6-diaminopimelate ligase